MNRITGVTGRNALEGNDVERTELSGGEMEKVIKHVSRREIKNSWLNIKQFVNLLHNKHCK